MSAAIEQARSMLIELGGPLGWNSTRERWRESLARKVSLNPRRVRAILAREHKLRLAADEYLLIEKAYQNAHRALEEISRLARAADVRAYPPDRDAGEGAVREGQPADGEARPAADAIVRPAR